MGKACDQAIHRLLGGMLRDRTKCFKYVPHDKPEIMAAEGQQVISKGYDTTLRAGATVPVLPPAGGQASVGSFGSVSSTGSCGLARAGGIGWSTVCGVTIPTAFQRMPPEPPPSHHAKL